MNKKQVLLVHGGDNFETYEEYLKFLNSFEVDFEKDGLGKSGWKSNLAIQLGDGYQVVAPKMPNAFNAKYSEWKIWFEKFIPFLQDGIILVGHSLGGSFLTKYLSENKFPKTVSATFLIAAAYGDNLPEYKLLDFAVPGDLTRFEAQSEKIFLYHSQDDPVVPFTDLEKFQRCLPNARVRIFTDKKHFNQSEFVELADEIKNLS